MRSNQHLARVRGTIGGRVPFLDPIFYADPLVYFTAPGSVGETPLVVDMETAPVARLAAQSQIRASRR